MKIRDIFETKVEEKIDPVVKVGERQSEAKLASEIGSYVVTPTIEKWLDDFMEHYTDSFLKSTTEIGVWISGYFGSGKSYLAKIVSLLIENPRLEGLSAAKRFESRIPVQADRRESILRNLRCLDQCSTQVIAFNVNTLADSKSTPLPRLLLSQYYQSKGYGSNVHYARVIESELDKRGKLADLHERAEKLAKKSWAEIQKNLTFYARHLYQAACELAPDAFSSPDEVFRALRNAESGELLNVQFLVRTILDDLEARQKALGKPCRLVLVLDESGQWIEGSGDRLSQLQALVEEAAEKGQGKLWLFVTTHEDIASLYKNALPLQSHGDFKKIESRFRRPHWSLTTENIELVLEDRLFKKNLAGKAEVIKTYNENPGVLRDLGELKGSNQTLPPCSENRFTTFYPFFPCHIHLIPEIVKSLRSAGGRGEQLSGSTRTLLAITQDILRLGRRKYLDCALGEVVSFDEVYDNLSGEGEVSPDARRELARIEQVVPDANPLTRRVAEVLYLIRELPYIPRNLDNLARLLVEHTTDDLSSLINRIQPELEKLIKAKLVAHIGEEYEFLTGERRTFEEEVAEAQSQMKLQDLEEGLAPIASTSVLGFSTIPFKNAEFPARISFDSTMVSRDGHIDIRVSSPLKALEGLKVSDLEDRSLQPDHAQALFVLCDRIPELKNQLAYYLAIKKVVDRWKGDPNKSEEARKLASDRESNDLEKQRQKVLNAIKDGIRNAHVIFRGSSRPVSPKPGQTPGESLRSEIAAFWPTLYPKYEKVPVRVINEQKAILDVLKGSKDLSPDVRQLKLFDNGGQVDLHCPLLDAVRVYLAARQSRKERTQGKDLLGEFEKPPYGWDPAAIRVGAAALVRCGALKVILNKKPFTNPADPELQDSIRVSRNFDKVELVLEEMEIQQEVLTEVRSCLIKLTGKRKIDETPAALAEAFESFGTEMLGSASKASLWAEPAGLALPPSFSEGKEVFEKILALSNPIHRVNELYQERDNLEDHAKATEAVSRFVDKWGKSFLEVRDFSKTLGAVEYRLPSSGSCPTFLANWRTAEKDSKLIQEEVWKDLQNGKGTADLELQQCLSSWREEARKSIQEALDRLPQDLAAHQLPVEELAPALSTPLKDLIAAADGEKDVVRIASLPDRARNLVDKLRREIQAEADKHKKKSKKPIINVCIVEIAKTVRIENEAQWDSIRDKLDKTVKGELAKGNEVELS